MKKLLALLSCSALCILPVFASGDSSSAQTIPTVGDSGFTLVDALAILLAAAILCGVVVLFYRVLRPKPKGDRPPRLKRR